MKLLKCVMTLHGKKLLTQFSLRLTFALIQFQTFNLFVVSCVKFSIDLKAQKFQLKLKGKPFMI